MRRDSFGIRDIFMSRFLHLKSITRLASLFFLFLPCFAFSGVAVVKRVNTYVTTGENVYWDCVERFSSTDNYCYIDVDSIFGSQYGWQRFYNSVYRSWSTPGVYRISTGTEYCSIMDLYCGSPSGSITDTVIVAPSGGWSLELDSDGNRADVGSTFRFYATSETGSNCCTFQWQFGDGTTREDYQTDGSSTVTKTYNTPGNYTVKVWLEAPSNDEDFRNASGGRVEQSLTVRVDAIPSPPPSPVSNFRANLHKSGLVYQTLYQNDQQGVLWTNHETDEDNSFSIAWGKPSNAKTRIEYRVDFGTVGRNAYLEDIDWTLFNTYDASITTAYMVALPPEMRELYYANKLHVPFETFDPESDDYIMIYYRLKTYNSDGSSSWRYLPGIWYYTTD